MTSPATAPGYYPVNGLRTAPPAVTKPVVATQEIGYAQSVNYNWWLYDQETTPELVWPTSVFVYDQMRRTDSQVKSVLNAVMWPIERTPWRIDPNGASAMVTELVATDVGLPIMGRPDWYPQRKRGDDFCFSDHLRQALLSLVFGHYYFEQVYSVDPDGSTAHLAKLAPRPPKTIDRINVAQDGSLVSIQQWWVVKDERPQPIPANRLVAYVNEMEGGNWLGISILRPAYKNWLLKDRLLRVQAQTIERNGMGIPLYTGAEGEESLTPGLTMATKWRAGEAAGTAIPNGAAMTLVGVSGTLPDAEPAIRYHDEQIGKAVLAHFLNLGNTRGTGSWALGSTFADFFTLSLQKVAQAFADTFTAGVIEDLVDANFGPDEPAPRLVFDEIGSRADPGQIAVLLQSGAIVPDDTLEGALRLAFGLPPKDEATQRQASPGGQVPNPSQQFDQSVAAAAWDDEDEDRELTDDEQAGVDALLAVLNELDGRVQAAYDPKELRQLKGHEGGGQFASTLNGKVLDALKEWLDGKNDRPLDGFNATQLRAVMKKRGLPNPPKGTKASAMRRTILDDVKAKHSIGEPIHPGLPAAPKLAKAPVPAGLEGLVTETHHVTYSGQDIGQVHKVDGGWIATFPNNGGGLPIAKTQAEAVQGLVDFHTHGAPDTPEHVPSKPGTPTANDLETAIFGNKHVEPSKVPTPAVDKAPDWVGHNITYDAHLVPLHGSNEHDHFNVKQAGKTIGSVHGGGPNGAPWSAYNPNGGKLGDSNTRDGAAALLVDHHKVNTPKAPAKPAAPGPKVTTQKQTTMIGKKYSAAVMVDGKKIGAVHQGYDGAWTAVKPLGTQKNGGVVGPLATRKAAVDAVVAKPNKVPGKPGVTWTLTEPKKLPGWSQPKQSQFIHQDGLFLGSVHQMEGSGWKADLPNGGHVDTSYKASKTDAINALIKARDDARANLAPQISVKPPPPGQKAESVLTPPKAGAKFELLADTGESGDGYAPGGQWGKYGASGILIQSTEGGQTRYLLVQRGPKVTNNQGKWQLPGGALNSKENAYQGAARETVEEVGAPHDYVGTLKPVGENVFTHDATGWKYTTIAATTDKTFTPTVDGTETSDAKWFTAAEIEKMRSDGQLVPKLDTAIGPIIDSYPTAAPRKATAAEKAVRAGDFSALKQVGMQSGSNEGGVFEAPDGSQWYVKAQKSAEHANNEALASTFYRTAGIEAPEVIRGKGAPGLSGENHTATRMIPNAKADLKAHVLGADKGVAADRAYMGKVHEGFAMDAWLGNWDVAGSSFDNILTDEHGNPVRVDPGGALLFRAQGEPKGEAFGPGVPEWDSFTDKNATRPTAALFDTMTSHEMVRSAEKVKAFTPAKIRSLVKSNGLDPELAHTLIERRKDILTRAAVEAKAPRKAFAEGAAVEDKALAAVKLQGTGSKMEQALVSEGVSHSQAAKTAGALSSYKGSGYEDVNGYLLDGPITKGWSAKDREAAAEKVRHIDVAYAHSALPTDIVIFRGERNPSRNFPPGEWSLTGGMEGKEWTFPAFMSTSTQRSTAYNFAMGHTPNKNGMAQPTVMRVVVPKGTAAITLDEANEYADEREVLLNRHLRYRVVKDHGVKNGVRNLDVMVVGS